MKSLTILVPTFQEEDNISECARIIDHLCTRLRSTLMLQVDVLIVDNHSKDATFQMASEIASGRLGWSVIQLDRNYGVQGSLLLGMSMVNSDGLLVYQSDLQDPPEVAFSLVEAWATGKGSVIAGITADRKERRLDRLGRSLFYSILSKSSDYGLQPWFHDFYVLDKRVYSRLYRQGFQHEFIRGRIAEEFGVDYAISYSRNERKHGRSSFNFARKYTMALDGILRYGSKISRYVSIGSLCLIVFNFLSVLILLSSYIWGYRSPVQGWLSLVCINLIVLSAIGLLIAMVYEFLFRILRLSDVRDKPVVFRQSS